MEYTKDFVFNVHYEKEKAKKLHWTRRAVTSIKKHKILVEAIIIVVALMMIDTFLVTSFVKLLQSI